VKRKAVVTGTSTTATSKKKPPAGMGQQSRGAKRYSSLQIVNISLFYVKCKKYSLILLVQGSMFKQGSTRKYLLESRVFAKAALREGHASRINIFPYFFTAICFVEHH
jgi:hypothetical protein